MEQIFDKLHELQEVLLQKYRLEKEIREIPRALATKTEVLNRSKKNFIERNESLDEMKKRQKTLHAEMTEATNSRESHEKQMDSIKTQKEYEALDKEIKEAQDREQSLRKEIQRMDKEIEELQGQIEKTESQITQDEDELKEEEARIKAESSTKVVELEEMKKREDSIVPGLDDDILFKFERILKSKEGHGIVAIRNGTCTGCHMILPMQFVNDVRKVEKIMFCPYCSRVLQFESNMDPDHQFQDNEAGSLADLVDED